MSATNENEIIIARSVQYKKNIEPELEEENPEYVYYVKTYAMDGTYAGLYESADWKKEFDNEDEARVAFESAIELNEYSAVELIEFDANRDSMVRENVIDEWEKELEEEEEEEEIDYIEPELVKAKENLKKRDYPDEFYDEEFMPIGTKVYGKVWDGEEYQTDEEEMFGNDPNN